MTTLIDYALMANAAYRDTRGRENRPVVPEGWTLLDRTQFGLPSTPDASGFSAEIFQKGTEIVISFEGTNPDAFTAEGLKDWITNFGLYSGSMTNQLRSAALLYERVKQQLGPHISFTGHSLGGGIASLMSAFFGRSATVFAPAPFQATVNLTNVWALQDLLTQNNFSDSALNTLADNFEALLPAREQTVTGYFINGEALDTFRSQPLTFAQWPLQPINVGNTELGEIGRHSMLLHAAALESLAFRNASIKLPTLLKLMADETLYAKKLSDENRKDFLQRLLEFQFGTPSLTKNDMLNRYGLDLQRIGTNTSLIAQAPLREGLIIAAIEYYNFVQPTLLTDFFNSETDGVRFDLNSINLARSQQKGYTKLRDFITQTYGSLLPDPSLLALDTRQQWFLQAGPGGMTATSSGNIVDFMLGADNGDYLNAGDGDDLIITQGGNDTLTGGQGNDVLVGGAGDDTYYYTTGDGHDTLIDSDRLGQIVYIDQNGFHHNATGGTRLNNSTGAYQSADQRLSYTLNGSTLDIAFDGAQALTINNFQDGDLGLTFYTSPAPQPSGTVTAQSNADILSPDALGLPVVYDVRMDGSLGNDLIEGAVNDSLNGNDGTDWISANQGNDTIDGGAGNDFIQAGSGRDIARGGAGNDFLTAFLRFDLPPQNILPVLTSVTSSTSNDYFLLTHNDAPTWANFFQDWTWNAGFRMNQPSGRIETNYGGEGDDFISGGPDSLISGTDNDTLYGEAGNDLKARQMMRSHDSYKQGGAMTLPELQKLAGKNRSAYCLVA